MYLQHVCQRGGIRPRYAQLPAFQRLCMPPALFSCLGLHIAMQLAKHREQAGAWTGQAAHPRAVSPLDRTRSATAAKLCGCLLASAYLRGRDEPASHQPATPSRALWGALPARAAYSARHPPASL